MERSIVVIVGYLQNGSGQFRVWINGRFERLEIQFRMRRLKLLEGLRDELGLTFELRRPRCDLRDIVLALGIILWALLRGCSTVRLLMSRICWY